MPVDGIGGKVQIKKNAHLGGWAKTTHSNSLLALTRRNLTDKHYVNNSSGYEY
ncbi:hypothetical protein DaDZ19_24600 [Dickeya ananatis]